MENVILDIKNISKSFFYKTSGNNYILKNFNLSIEKQKVTALIGGNGTGKTTLFNIISGFLEPDKNSTSEIIFETENNLLKIPSWKIPRQGIGRLFQDVHIFPDLTIMENMKVADSDVFGETPLESVFFTRKIKTAEKKKEKKVMAIFADVFGKNSTFVKNSGMFAGDLSYGEQRLLGMVRLLAGNYSLILLDEPTSGVHPKLLEKISEIIRLMILHGKTVFLIEHNMAFIRQVADTVAFIMNGKIHTKGKPELVLADEIIIKKYLGMA